MEENQHREFHFPMIKANGVTMLASQAVAKGNSVTPVKSNMQWREGESSETMYANHAKDGSRPQKELLREQTIRALLAREGDRLSQGVIDALRRDLGVSRATAYRIIKTFRTCGTVTPPTNRPVGRPKGARVLDARREFIIRDTIEVFFLQPTRPKFNQLVREIGERCQKEQLPTPNWRTIKARVNDIDLAARARRRNGFE
jgi:DtxR family transcriptional regulator, manganese transport regulator